MAMRFGPLAGDCDGDVPYRREDTPVALTGDRNLAVVDGGGIVGR
jgi:hypothetical protein